MVTATAIPRIVLSPADVERRKVMRRGAERQIRAIAEPSRIQAIHAGKEGFILRGMHSETFWEW